MLVLNRKAGESFTIDGRIIIKVLGESNNTPIRIGIEAPKHIKIVRNELLQNRPNSQEKE